MIKRLAVVSLLLLAACGGGGGGGSASVPSGAASPTPAPLPTVNSSSWQSTAKLTFTINRGTSPLPTAHQRGVKDAPLFISPSATYMDVTVNSVNGSTTLPSWVPTSTVQIPISAVDAQPNCNTNGPIETCTITIPAPPGTVNYTFTATDGTFGLATQTGNQTLVQGQNANLSITLAPIVNLVTTSMSAATNVNFDSNGSQTITVVAYDADGNPITSPGAYAHPFTLTDTETGTSGTTNLGVNGGAGGATVTITAPTDFVTLYYTGQAFNSFSFTAAGSTATSGLSEKYANVMCASAASCQVTAQTPYGISFTGTTPDDAPGGQPTDPNYTQPTLFFAAADAAPQTITASEVAFEDGGAYLGTFDLALDPASCGTGASAVATVSTSPAISWTVTPQNVGICKATVSEAGNGYPLTGDTSPTRGVFYISVTAATLSANGKHRAR